MKKILYSLLTVGTVAVVAVVATTAFFSDTETSTDNTFTAGAIDLKIDNDSYVTDNDGKLVLSSDTSWELDDLTGKLFFNFTDLKPGDIGEDTISIRVDDNDAWACLAIEMTENSDNTCTEPENEDDSDCVEYDENNDATHINGELAENLQIAVWDDDGDNVYEDHERLLQLGGAGNPIVTLQALAGLSEDGGPAGILTLADSDYSVFTEDPNLGEPLEGGKEYHLAKAWCFGKLVDAPADESNQNPEDRKETGFTCDGEPVNNAAQTDRVIGNLEFYAEQARNNPGFQCGT